MVFDYILLVKLDMQVIIVGLVRHNRWTSKTLYFNATAYIDQLYFKYSIQLLFQIVTNKIYYFNVIIDVESYYMSMELTTIIDKGMSHRSWIFFFYNF